MRLFISTVGYVTLLLCACLTFAVDTAKYSNSITLSYEFISSTPQSVKPLCTVFYDPKTLKYALSSWTPPSLDSLKSTTPEATNAPLLRILTPSGSSTVTSLSTFSHNLDQQVALWLSSDPSGDIFSASVTSITPPALSAEEEQFRKKVERAKARGKPVPTRPQPAPKKQKAKKDDKAKRPDAAFRDPDASKVSVTLIPAKPGPTARLGSRAPPQVDSEGNEIPRQEEQEKSFFQKYWYFFLIAAFLAISAGGGSDK